MSPVGYTALERGPNFWNLVIIEIFSLCSINSENYPDIKNPKNLKIKIKNPKNKEKRKKKRKNIKIQKKKKEKSDHTMMICPIN